MNFKSLFLSVALLLCVLSASAQFEEGKKYVGANVSGFGMSYSGHSKFQMGLGGQAGFFISDDWLLLGQAGFEHHAKRDNNVSVAASARYYFEQNGIFLGAGIGFDHFLKNENSLNIPLEAGYCFFLNRYLTLEPALFGKISLNEFSKHSSVGIRLGLGYYF